MGSASIALTAHLTPPRAGRFARCRLRGDQLEYRVAPRRLGRVAEWLATEDRRYLLPEPWQVVHVGLQLAPEEGFRFSGGQRAGLNWHVASIQVDSPAPRRPEVPHPVDLAVRAQDP